MKAAATERPPVIILGAARSGTKLLRRIIAESPQIAEIPYDINFVWRLGNMDVAHDALEPAAARPEVRQQIRRYFAGFRTGDPAGRVVEKTVSNALRVPFVRRVFPEARLIHLVRDGRDVAASSFQQWRTPLPWRDVLKKLRRYPFWSARRYTMAYVGNYLRKTIRGDAGVRSWGPVYPGMHDDVRDRPLAAVCARQWLECVTVARRDLASVPAADCLEIRYEDLVREPGPTTRRVFDHLELDVPETMAGFLAARVRNDIVGTWRQRLEPADQDIVESMLQPTLKDLGYTDPGD